MSSSKSRFLLLIIVLNIMAYFLVRSAIEPVDAQPELKPKLNASTWIFLPVIRGSQPYDATPTATIDPNSTATMTATPTATIDPNSTATMTATPTATIDPNSTATPTPTQTPIPTPTPEANCRYGTAAESDGFDLLPVLGAGWILKFNSPYWTESKPENDAERVHIIKTHQRKTDSGVYLPEYYTNVPLNAALANYIRTHPGRLWMIGNEVDRGPQPGEIAGGQGDMHPEIYAVAFHDVQAFIKANDPTARVAISGLVQVTPGRLQYLDKTWDAYVARYGAPMPVDVWNMHIYVLPEVTPSGEPNGFANVAVGTDPALGKRGSGGSASACSDPDVYCIAEHDDLSVFIEQVRGMRQWMKDHGQQQKPLILSEYSILIYYGGSGSSCYTKDEYGNCFSPDRVSRFMDDTFDYLENARGTNLGYALDDHRLVQQWLWFSVNFGGPGSSSNLAKDDLKTLTQVGQNYRDHVKSQPFAVNLIVDHVPQSVATIGSGGTAVAELSVQFRNKGNTAVYTPFKVSFYEDAARTREIDSVMVSPELRGCATDFETAVVQWPGLGAGQHQFWVHIDSENVIAEPPGQEYENIGSGFVQVNQ